MEPAARGLAAFGFAFDPFEYLDSTKDAHLQEYLVIPQAVQIALSDQPVAIFAQPGGGKSALRMYAENFYTDSRGLKFPLTYTPETYSNAPHFHFQGIQRAIARAAFMYLVSYPDLFFALTPQIKRTIKTLLLDVPFGLDFNLRALTESRFLSDLEQALSAPAFSNLPELGGAHRQLARDLEKESAFPNFLALEDCFTLLTDAFGAKSIHILVDGLDGFMETHDSQALLAWIEPFLKVLEDWNRKNIYLKFFLPMDISDAPALTEQGVLRAAALTWDDNLLAEVVRRRVFVATRGAFDSLDAVSAPDLRNVELTLARQLGEKEKLPRQIILKSRELLQNIIKSNKKEILPKDLSSIREPSYVTAI
ncbi:MAG: hypothetical protein HXY42_08415 [Chloroflexi bacterium]|nr:hypothetical protein [Chloroflexota bacterium]